MNHRSQPRPEAPIRLEARGSSGLGYLLGVLGVFALIAGTLRSSGGLLALGVLLVTVPCCLWILLFLARAGVRFERRLPEVVFEGERVEVGIALENRSRWPVFFPRVSEIFPPEIHAQKDLVITDRLLPGEKIEKSYEGYCVLPRGIYSVGPTTLRFTDPFGWFELRRSVKRHGSLKVYPEIRDFGVREQLGDWLSHFAEQSGHRRVGDGDEFRGVREYRPGDPLQRVHWPLTAKHGLPIVKEPVEPNLGQLHLFLDLQRGCLVGAGRSSSLETSVRIAGSLAAHALRSGSSVSVAAGLDAATLQITLGQSGVHLHALLDLLVGVRATLEDEYLSLLEESSSSIGPGSTVVLPIHPYLFPDRRLPGLLRDWVRRGARVVAILFDRESHSVHWDESDRASEKVLHALRGLGLDCYLVPCAADLEAVFAGEEALAGGTA